MTFSDWLRREREAVGLSQEDLERKTGRAHKYVARLENNPRSRPTTSTRLDFHKVFGTSDEDLFNLGILKNVGRGGESWYDWPSRYDTENESRSEPASTPISVAEAVNQIRNEADGVRWNQQMVDTVVMQIRMFRNLQARNDVE